MKDGCVTNVEDFLYWIKKTYTFTAKYIKYFDVTNILRPNYLLSKNFHPAILLLLLKLQFRYSSDNMNNTNMTDLVSLLNIT